MSEISSANDPEKGKDLRERQKPFFVERNRVNGRHQTKEYLKNLNAIILTLHKCQSCPVDERSDPLIDILNTKQRHFHTQVLDMGTQALHMLSASI